MEAFLGGCKYMYTYIYMIVYVQIYIYTYTYIGVSVYTYKLHTYTYMHHMYVYIYVHIHIYRVYDHGYLAGAFLITSSMFPARKQARLRAAKLWGPASMASSPGKDDPT